MDIQSINKQEKKYIIPTYTRFPLCFKKGKGAYLWDIQNKKYLDFLSGIGVTNLGHSHPHILKVLQKQAKNLIHTSNLYYIESQIKLAKLLSKYSFSGQVFFCNSGTEANEAAIKLVRRYSYLKFGSEKYEIITMKNSFHGRTLGSLTATGQEKYQQYFSPLFPGFKYVEFNNFNALEKNISSKTSAIMIEPIQGEGGINVASYDYLKKIRKLCNEKNILLIFDEVQCGIGRTGKFFCYEHYKIKPDILTLAKSLGNGLPIGAMISKKEISKYLCAGTHGSTFGGNPLICEVSFNVVLEIIKLLPNVEKMGIYLKNKLETLQKKYSFITEIRGLGLMIGIEGNFEAKNIIKFCYENGVLIGSAGKNILRFLPPLIITKTDINKIIKILDKAFSLLKTS
ncbi:MAG: aspartate aminotransferase family protein [bacterium]